MLKYLLGVVEPTLCRERKIYSALASIVLMAKQLIQRILQAQDIRSLKLCQMQWITSLQETRLPPKALNQILQQINHSLQKLNPT